jgi:hypothetical protein
VRLHETDKQRFGDAAESVGMDASVVARRLIELMLRRLDQGGDLLDAIQEAKNAWQQRQPGLGAHSVNSDEASAPSRDSFEYAMKRIDELEAELRRRDAKQLKRFPGG